MTTLVVGAGLAGLVRADALASLGRTVSVIERSDRPGGVIRTERRDGFLLELGPNTIRPTPELLALARELGLESQAILTDPRLPRYLAWNGILHELPSSAASFAATPLLSAKGKLRVLAEPFIRRRGAPDETDETDETVADFFSRRLGAEIAERFVAPFVSGVFAGDPGRLSAEAAFPNLVRGEREHGSLAAAAFARLAANRKQRPGGSPAPIVRDLLGFRDGLESLPRALAGRIGNRLETGVEALAVDPGRGAGEGRAWSIRTSAGARTARQLVLACPASDAARLVAGFAPEAAEALAAIPQPPLAVLHFSITRSALPAPLRGFGHLAIRPAAGVAGRRLLGAVWSSSLFPDRAPDGFDLVTAYAGGSTDPEAAALPDSELASLAARELAEALRMSGGESPRLLRLTRWRGAIPQYERGHLARIEALARAEARWPGLVFLGSYRGGISVGDVVRTSAAVDAAPV